MADFDLSTRKCRLYYFTELVHLRGIQTVEIFKKKSDCQIGCGFLTLFKKRLSYYNSRSYTQFKVESFEECKSKCVQKSSIYM